MPAYNEEKLIGLGMSFIPVIETMPVAGVLLAYETKQDIGGAIAMGYNASSRQ